MADRSKWKLSVCPAPDSDPQLIYTNVGKALTSWERLDTTLLMTFGFIIGSQHFAALRALGRVESPAARLTVLLEAFRSADSTTQKKLPAFEETIKQVDQLTQARNAIAHGQVSQVRLKDGPIGYYLTPGAITTRKVSRPSEQGVEKMLAAQTEAEAISVIYSYAMTTSRIAEYGMEFERLWEVAKGWQVPGYSFPG